MVVLLLGPVLAGGVATVVPALSAGTGDLGAPLARLIAWPGLPGAVALSVLPGLGATAASLAITVLMLATLQGGRFLGLFLRVLSPLLSVPHAAAALGLAFLIAPSGWIVRALSPWATGWTAPPDLLILNDPAGLALMAGLIAKEVPFLMLMALAALPQCDPARRMAVAESLGRGRLAAFLTTVLPSLHRQIRLPVYAVLAYSMTVVDMAMILGPSLPPPLAVQIIHWMTDPDLMQRDLAAAGALLQLGLVLAALLIWRGVEAAGRSAILMLATGGWRGAGADRPAWLVAAGLGTLLAGGLILGLAGLSLWSVAGLWPFPEALPHDLSLREWARAAPGLSQTLPATLCLAAASTLAALVIVLACLQGEYLTGRRVAHTAGRGMMWLLYLPLIVPQVVFLPGLQDVAIRLGLQGGMMAVVMAHLTFVLPYVFLSLAPAWQAWDGRVARVGASLGAGEGRIFWRLRLPMLLRPVLTAAAVGVAVSVGQYLPTLLIGGGRIETLTTEAVALSSGGNRRVIGVHALLQMLLPAIAFGLAVAVPAVLFRHRRGMAVSR